MAILISLLLPALGKARLLGRQTVELAAAQQLMVAYGLYSDDSDGRVLVGYASSSMVRNDLVVLDHAGNRLTGALAQRYPWRVLPYLDSNLNALYLDADALEDLRQSSGGDYTYVSSLFPRFGINARFVGGDDSVLAFDPRMRQLFGRYFIERMDQPRDPSGLLVFVSSRPNQSVLDALPVTDAIDGFHRVLAPRFQEQSGLIWDEVYDPHADMAATNSGHVALRFDGRAVAAFFDGHAGVLGWRELHDMRRWADGADSADWSLVAR